MYSRTSEVTSPQNFQALAAGLPCAKHQHSRLICAITKELMNEDNPPMVLPSGTVYSEKAIQQHTKQDQFLDPATGKQSCPLIILHSYLHCVQAWHAFCGANLSLCFLTYIQRHPGQG